MKQLLQHTKQNYSKIRTRWWAPHKCISKAPWLQSCVWADGGGQAVVLSTKRGTPKEDEAGHGFQSQASQPLSIMLGHRDTIIITSISGESWCQSMCIFGLYRLRNDLFLPWLSYFVTTHGNISEKQVQNLIPSFWHCLFCRGNILLSQSVITSKS